MRASSKTLLLALAMAGCSVYDETSLASPRATAGASGSVGGSGGPSGGLSGSGGSGANDGASDVRGNTDASGAAGAGGTSGTGGSSGTGGAGAGGSSGAAGSSGVAGAAGAGGTIGSGGTSGAAGAAGASGSSGAAGSSGTGGSTGTDGSTGVDGAGVDQSDAGPCVTGTGPANLPFAVDQYFLASGWMQPALIRQDATCVYPPSTDAGSAGDAGRDGSGADAPSGRDGSSTDGSTIPPLPGSKCWTITYTPTLATDWAGVDWQYPINNWGASPGLVIPPGAARVSVVAWGDTGSETVSFNVGYGVTSPDAFAASLNNQVLTTSPTRYAVDMSGIAYTCNSVRMGFGWVASGGTTMTFHIADIRWE